MSGQDMRKLMENLNSPEKKTKLNESLGGTPIANDIMELAAKLEAIQNTPVEDEALNEDEDGRIYNLRTPDGKEIYSVHIFTGEDHNLIVRARSAEEAEEIIKTKYLPAIEMGPSAYRLGDEEAEWVLDAKGIAEMDKTGFYLYDQGT